MNQTNDKNELNLFYEKYSKDFADLALFYNISNFTTLSLKDKISVLAHKLKAEKRFNFAGFLFDKLFTTFLSMNALINKIECLIAVGKLEKALHFNDIAFELFLEMEDVGNIENVEKALAYQKAKIYFLSSNFVQTSHICENYIVKAKQKRFFTLFCATLIVQGDFNNAEKLLKRFHNQIHNFLAETILHLASINRITNFADFIKSTKNLRINNIQTLITNIEVLTGGDEEIQLVDKILKQEIIFLGNTSKSALTTEVVQCKE